MNITNTVNTGCQFRANSGMHSTEIYSARTGIHHNFTNRNFSTINTLAYSLSSPTFCGPLVSTALSDRIVVDQSQTDKCTLESGSSNSQSINDIRCVNHSGRHALVDSGRAENKPQHCPRDKSDDAAKFENRTGNQNADEYDAIGDDPDYINTIGETFRDSDVYADCIRTPGDESSPNDIIPEVMARMPGNKGILKGRSLMVEQGSVTKLYAHNTPTGGQVLANPVSGSSENTVFIRLDPEEKGDSMYQKILSAANNTNPSKISIDDINKLRQKMARFIRDNPELAEDANDARENDPFYKLSIDEAVDTYQNTPHSEDSIYTHQPTRPWLEPLMHMLLAGVGPANGNLFKRQPLVGQLPLPKVTSVAINDASVARGFKSFMNDQQNMDRFNPDLENSIHELKNKALYCHSNNVKPVAPPVPEQTSLAESVPSTETVFFKNSLGAAFDILSGMDSFLRFPMAEALPFSETENPTADTTTEQLESDPSGAGTPVVALPIVGLGSTPSSTATATTGETGRSTETASTLALVTGSTQTIMTSRQPRSPGSTGVNTASTTRGLARSSMATSGETTGSTPTEASILTSLMPTDAGVTTHRPESASTGSGTGTPGSTPSSTATVTTGEIGHSTETASTLASATGPTQTIMTSRQSLSAGSTGANAGTTTRGLAGSSMATTGSTTGSEFTTEADLDCAVVAKKYDSVAENTLARCMHIEILRDNPWMLSKIRDIVENTTEYQPSLIISFSELVSNLGRKDEYTADKLVSLKTGYLEAMSEKKLNLLESAREAGKITTRTHDKLTDYLELFKQRLNKNEQPALDTRVWFKSEFDGIHLLIPYTMGEVLSGAISGFDPDQFLAPPAVQPFINYLTRENATELIDEAYEKIQSTADIADALASEIDENNLRNTLQSLLMHGPRFATTPSTSYMRYRTEFTEYSPDKYESALQEIKANISALGLPVYQQYIDTYNTYAMSRPYVNTSNLFTFMPGKSTDLVSVGAHLDTFRETVGANDNGSGVVSLLETIRVLTESDVEFENPVLFCFWAKEEKPPRVFEIGLVGSMHFTQNTQEVLNHFTNGTSGAGSSGKMAIKCHINLDIVGGKGNGNSPTIFFEDPNAPGIHELLADRRLYPTPKGTDKLSQMFANYFKDRSIPFATTKPVFISDQNNFHFHGIPAVLLSSADVNCLHQACDDINNVDFTTLTNCTMASTNIITRLAMERDNWFVNP